MVFAIRHRGLESPEVLWRRNLRLDAIKLGSQLHGKFAKRPNMDAQRIAAGIIRPHEARHFEEVALYNNFGHELTKSFRNGFLLTQVGPITQIKNFNTGTAYDNICDAVYLASSGDEIILPAGCGALDTGMAFRRYSHWTQLSANAAGYTNSSNEMIIGNPAQASTSATYLSIVGIPSTNTLSSVSWASTSGGQLTVVISGSAITTYRKGMFVRLSGCTNTGTGGAVAGKLNSINNTFIIFSVSGSTLVLTASASAGVYGTIGGSPVLNNDRAQISAPVGYLTTALNPGDTTIVLDDASDFRAGGASGNLTPWGNGDGTWQFDQMSYTGISGNTLTGVTGSGGLASTVPVGNPIISVPPSQKALLTPAATNSIGITLTALELWGAAVGGGGPAAASIFQWTAPTGSVEGNTILSNVFIHDGNHGIRPGGCSVGSGVFLKIYDSEIWRCGLAGGDRNHNIYIDYDVFTFQNSISWQPIGVFLVKSRSRVNYCLYSRTYGAHGSAANVNGTWTSNYDFPNGGLVYLIGCIGQQSEQDNGALVRFQEETGQYPTGGIGNNGYNGALGTSNPSSELYVVNSNLLGPSNGTGYSFASSFANNSPVLVGFPGLTNPEVASVTTTSGGSLPARSYWLCTTAIDSGGNESLPSCMTGNNSTTTAIGKISIGANSLAVLASPVARTGAVNYNAYAAHADPDIWWNSGSAVPPATGPNLFFYDSAFTLPVCVVNSGGSQPAAFVYVGITYVFAEGESVNFAVSGNDLRFPGGSPVTVNAAMISVPINNLLTIKSPPAKTGATGWYPYAAVVSYNGAGFYGNNVGGGTDVSRFFVSKQVFTPIAIGTDWVQSSGFFVAATCSYNFYKQNASPITIGTGWTEPTSGLTSHNPTNLLQWYQRGVDAGFSEWFAVAQGSFTNYVVNLYNDHQWGSYFPEQANGTVTVWTGAVSGANPFDVDYPGATLATSSTSTTATTAASHTTIVAAFRDSATAGAGWTQQASLSFLMVESKTVTTAQTGLAVTQVGGGSASILVDALSGTITQHGSAVTSTANTNNMQFTIPSISAGDVLILHAAIGNGPLTLSVDPLAWGPPTQNQAIGSSPLGIFVNNISAYYNPTGAGGAGGGYGNGGWVGTFPGIVQFGGAAYPTVSSFNLQSDVFNGSTFAAPLVAAVWTDATNFDFTLAGGSPAIGAGTTPGTGHSFSLVPTSQTSMIGTPTPGQPIAALTTRTDSGGTLGAIGSGSAPPSPTLRLKFKFGWDWKLGLAIVLAGVITENPTVSRRRMLLLSSEETT